MDIIGGLTVEKSKLTSYQLRGSPQVCFKQWKEERAIDADPLDWEKLKGDFLDFLFPLEMREVKILEFITFCQGNVSVKEYALKFTQFTNSLSMVVVSQERINKIVSGMSEMVVTKCCTTILIKDMDIS